MAHKKKVSLWWCAPRVYIFVYKYDIDGKLKTIFFVSSKFLRVNNNWKSYKTSLDIALRNPKAAYTTKIEKKGILPPEDNTKIHLHFFNLLSKYSKWECSCQLFQVAGIQTLLYCATIYTPHIYREKGDMNESINVLLYFALHQYIHRLSDLKQLCPENWVDFWDYISMCLRIHRVSFVFPLMWTYG